MLYGVCPRPILKQSATWASCNPAAAAVTAASSSHATAAVTNSSSTSSTSAYPPPPPPSYGSYHYNQPCHPASYDAYPWIGSSQPGAGVNSTSSSAASNSNVSPRSDQQRHHVRFPQSPSTLTRTAATHSSAVYDRSPIVVDQNTCKLPERGCPGRTYMLDEYDRKNYAFKQQAQAASASMMGQQQLAQLCLTDVQEDSELLSTPEEESIAYHKALPSSKIYMESKRPKLTASASSSSGAYLSKRPCMRRSTRFGGEELEGGDGCLGGF